MRKTFYIFILPFSYLSVAGQVLTVGPMLHCYFPNGKPKITFGVEAAIHFLVSSNRLIPSIDFGIEGGKGVTYLYSEFQLTRPRDFGYEGFSIGIFKKNQDGTEDIKGLQMTAWWANFYGGDIRFRLGKNYINGGIGGFGKLPIPLIGVHHNRHQ